MALVGLHGCGLLNLLGGHLPSRSDTILNRYPLPARLTVGLTNTAAIDQGRAVCD